uniref:Integral membrane protein n=1 Tax=Streptomyces sp. NBC_00049 TaxID=2903617 RepID=A0AAU2JS02_9ACTN
MALRVLFTLLPLLSCGFLAWASMLRLALLTRKIRDWVLMGTSIALCVLWVVLIELDKTPEDDGWQGNLALAGILITSFASCVYFLTVDIRHHEVKTAAAAAHWYPAQPAPYNATQQTTPSYGYPPQAPTPVPGQMQPPQVPPQAPAAPRIGQVRAELDELSELLRKQQDPHQTPHQTPNPFQDPNQ